MSQLFASGDQNIGASLFWSPSIKCYMVANRLNAFAYFLLLIDPDQSLTKV